MGARSEWPPCSAPEMRFWGDRGSKSRPMHPDEQDCRGRNGAALLQFRARVEVVRSWRRESEGREAIALELCEAEGVGVRSLKPNLTVKLRPLRPLGRKHASTT